METCICDGLFTAGSKRQRDTHSYAGVFVLRARVGEALVCAPEPSGLLPTIHSGHILGAQLTTCTSGAGGHPTQCKHGTLLPFFHRWPLVAKKKKHPTRRCDRLPHWLAHLRAPSLNYSPSQSCRASRRFLRRISVSAPV